MAATTPQSHTLINSSSPLQANNVLSATFNNLERESKEIEDAFRALEASEKELDDFAKRHEQDASESIRKCITSMRQCDSAARERLEWRARKYRLQAHAVCQTFSFRSCVLRLVRWSVGYMHRRIVPKWESLRKCKYLTMAKQPGLICQG